MSDFWDVGNTNGNLLGNESYKNSVLKSYEGPKPWPSWLQKIDETVTRFTYRNFGWVFGMDITPSSIVPAMEPGRLISMSEYGVYYSNTDQKIDQTLFLVSAFSFATSLSFTNNIITKSGKLNSTNNVLTLYNEWPENGGFLGGFYKTERVNPGHMFSRIGELNGKYVSPPGTTLSQRGLPSSYSNTNETLWKVIKPFSYHGGIASPWQDASGGGIQYKLPDTIENLWKNGYIVLME